MYVFIYSASTKGLRLYLRSQIRRFIRSERFLIFVARPIVIIAGLDAVFELLHDLALAPPHAHLSQSSGTQDAVLVENVARRVQIARRSSVGEEQRVQERTLQILKATNRCR